MIAGKQATRPHPRRIRRWRMVAGAAIHFVLPAYLLVLAGAAATGRLPNSAGPAALAAVWLGGRFLAIYAVASAAAIAVALGWDRLGRPSRTDPADLAGEAFDQPLPAPIGPAAERARQNLVQLLPALPPDRAAALARDGARVIDAAKAAVAAAPLQADAIGAEAAGALERLASAARQMADEQAATAVTRAAIIGRYIRDKYHDSSDGLG